MTDGTIEPDTKDWTWVLERPCPECGFDARTVTGPDLPALVEGWTQRWVQVLTRADVADRPSPAVWSPLEYACHVRDVYRVFAVRVTLMLEQEAPTFENWDQDAAAVQGRYSAQEPAAVALELLTAADDVAGRFGAVDGDQWERTGLRSNGSAFTVRTLGQYFAHDVVHHLHDVRA